MVKHWKIPKTSKVLEFSFLEPLLGDWSYIILDLEIGGLVRGDHSPSFRISLILLNLNVFEFHIYDSRHEVF